METFADETRLELYCGSNPTKAKQLGGVKMKFSRFIVSLSIVVLTLSLPLAAQSRGKAEAVVGGKKVSVEYGQPELKGRDMLAKAGPGMVWRFGMNEGTTLTTEADLQFGSVSVSKGAYTVFAKKVSEDTWHLVLNKQTGLWGTKRDESQDLPGIPFKISSGDSVEKFTVELKGSDSKGKMVAKWGTTILAVGFEAK
jgi:hypothetical protein